MSSFQHPNLLQKVTPLTRGIILISEEDNDQLFRPELFTQIDYLLDGLLSQTISSNQNMIPETSLFMGHNFRKDLFVFIIRDSSFPLKETTARKIESFVDLALKNLHDESDFLLIDQKGVWKKFENVLKPLLPYIKKVS